MTESELLNQAAKLKAIYAQNLNTTKQNSLNEMNADKASYTTDANNQLQEQKDTTQNVKTNADINAFNNAKKLRELASANGYTNGGELYSGVIQNEQQKGNTIGTANSDFSKYKGQWDNKLNEYNTKWNNNLNKLNSETDNAINEYNTKLDMDYKDKIDSLRAQIASAARSSSSGGSSSGTSMTKSELYDYRLAQLVDAMGKDNGWTYLKDNKEALRNDLGQTYYDKMVDYYTKKSTETDKGNGEVYNTVSNNMTTSMFHPVEPKTTTTSTKTTSSDPLDFLKKIWYGSGNY